MCQVCPECGSTCATPRDFVHHINSCGHLYRRSGIICSDCHICFFKSEEDFLAHWLKEHCNKNYECVVCNKLFESLVFHSCSSPGQQVLNTFKCVLSCPLCDDSVLVNTLEQDDIHACVKEHLEKCHPHSITRVYYVFKSKFCSNAFRSKDELRAHHDREHRRDNHYRNKSCSLHHTVMAAQHKFSISNDNNDQRASLITIPIILNAQEKEDARKRDIPTVSSILDKTLFPDLASAVNPTTGQRVTMIDGVKVDALTGEVLSDATTSRQGVEGSNSPYVCYRCGMTHTERKKHKRHVRGCTGEIRERVCRVCQNSFKGENFVLHCRYHMHQGVVLCMLCNGAQFESVEKLHNHFEKHAHEQFVYPAVCPFCAIVLPDVPTSLSHLKEKHSLLMSNHPSASDALNIPVVNSNHHTAQPTTLELSVSCDKCGRKFHGGRGLAIHASSCCGVSAPPTTGVSPSIRQCQACKRALTQESMGKHMAAHLQEGFVVCGLCDGKPIASSLDLLHHLEAHTNSCDYPYTCVMCQLMLDDAETALRHLKEEHGLGHLPCPECDMSYTFSQQLSRHTEIVHRICLYSKRRYICWICRAYDHVKKETLMNHFQIAHGLQRTQVNEKVMIRTRGQGTMPTSQFVPTKQINKKKPPTKNEKSPVEVVTVNKEKSSSSALSSPEIKPLLVVKESLELDQSTANVEESLSNLQYTMPAVNINALTSDPIVLPTIMAVDKTTLIDKVVNHAAVKKIQKIIKVDIKEAFAKQKVTKVKIEEATNSKKTLKLTTSPATVKSNDSIIESPLSSSLSSLNDSGVKRKIDTVLSDSEPCTEDVNQVNHAEPTSTLEKRKKKSKAYKCELCNFATNFHDKMQRHKQRHADGSVTGFVCQECGQSFVVRQSLARHMFFAHKIKWQGNEPPDTAVNEHGSNKRVCQDEVISGKKIKLDDISSYLDNNEEACMKQLPKIAAHVTNKNYQTELPKKMTESTITPIKFNMCNSEVKKISNLSTAESSNNLSSTKCMSQPPGLKKVTIVNMMPKVTASSESNLSAVSVDCINKQSPQIIPKTFVISKPIQIQPLVKKSPMPNIPRVPIKITNTSIVSVVSDKLNANWSGSQGSGLVRSVVTPGRIVQQQQQQSSVVGSGTASSIVRPKQQMTTMTTVASGLIPDGAGGTVTTAKPLTETGSNVNCIVKRRVSHPPVNGTDRQHQPPSAVQVSSSQVVPPTHSQVLAASQSLLSLSQVIVTQSTLPAGAGTNANNVAAVTAKAHPSTTSSTSSTPLVVTHSDVSASPASESPPHEDAGSLLPASTEGGGHQCYVCREEFTSPTEQYSHMRSHGMAFLQLGRKKRLYPANKNNPDGTDEQLQ